MARGRFSRKRGGNRSPISNDMWVTEKDAAYDRDREIHLYRQGWAAIGRPAGNAAVYQAARCGAVRALLHLHQAESRGDARGIRTGREGPRGVALRFYRAGRQRRRFRQCRFRQQCGGSGCGCAGAGRAGGAAGPANRTFLGRCCGARRCRANPAGAGRGDVECTVRCASCV